LIALRSLLRSLAYFIDALMVSDSGLFAAYPLLNEPSVLDESEPHV
jgi:hypothetical protein